MRARMKNPAVALPQMQLAGILLMVAVTNLCNRLAARQVAGTGW